MNNIRLYYGISLDVASSFISSDLYPNIVLNLYNDYKTYDLDFHHYLTFITKCWTNIYVQPEHYGDGTNYNWQLLGYKTSGLFGDNGEFPTYGRAIRAAIEYSLPIIEGVLEEMKKDWLYHFETTLGIATPEEQIERHKAAGQYLEKLRAKKIIRRKHD